MKLWRSKFNFLRMAHEAFFCEYKDDGYGEKSLLFSTKKFFAFILMMLAILNHGQLHFFPENHWTVVLVKLSVPQAVIISMIGSVDVLAGWAIRVYWKAKKDGVA